MSRSFLERLPGEIITQIVETLEKESPSSVFKLLFIRAAKNAAECVIYKSVIVPGSAWHQPSPRAKDLVDRILNPNDAASCWIRELDIEQCSGYHFPEIFHSRLPNLKSLRFTITRGANLRRIGDFLDSIQGLEELYITSAYNGFFPVLWSHIKLHGSTLQVLKTNNIEYGLWKWTKAALVDLLKTCLQLRSLAVDLEPEYEMQANGAKDFLWPNQIINSLGQFPQLSSLNIATVINNSRHGGPDGYAAKCLASELFKDFFRYDPKSRMRSLELTAIKGESAPIQEVYIHVVVVTLKRLEKDGTTSPLDGGFEGKIQTTDGRSGEVETRVF